MSVPTVPTVPSVPDVPPQRAQLWPKTPVCTARDVKGGVPGPGWCSAQSSGGGFTASGLITRIFLHLFVRVGEVTILGSDGLLLWDKCSRASGSDLNIKLEAIKGRPSTCISNIQVKMK